MCVIATSANENIMRRILSGSTTVDEFFQTKLIKLENQVYVAIS